MQELFDFLVDTRFAQKLLVVIPRHRDREVDTGLASGRNCYVFRVDDSFFNWYALARINSDAVILWNLRFAGTVQYHAL